MKRSIAAAVIGAVLVAGCAAKEPTTVEVTLAEWSVAASRSTVPAGDVIFSVKNEGTQEHEMLVVRSDAASGDLTVADGEIDEATIESLGEVPETAAGASGTLRLDALPKGHYILLCNIAGHYSQGMHTDLTVE